MAFADNLKRIREEKRLSQGDLAKITGLSQPTIAQYEIRVKSPKPESVYIISKALGVTCDDLCKTD